MPIKNSPKEIKEMPVESSNKIPLLLQNELKQIQEDCIGNMGNMPEQVSNIVTPVGLFKQKITPNYDQHINFKNTPISPDLLLDH